MGGAQIKQKPSKNTSVLFAQVSSLSTERSTIGVKGVLSSLSLMAPPNRAISTSALHFYKGISGRQGHSST
ncbi:unnamed protein product [Pieris brassicae]|uniref:Uncharacterized protein n=1 Tax=Pieris brassicae TaxID=7116 RepID=A0A9P0TND5_PIEBR|nr:unnamed protein product [Pieris brassicae]